MNKKTRKLNLSRETVRDLSGGDLRGVNGAATLLADSCTCTQTCPRPCSIVSCVTECTMCSDCCM